MEITIRTATKGDLPSILSIINPAIENTTILYILEPRTLEEQLEWLENLQANDMPVIVAEADGDIVGFGTFWQFRPLPAYQGSVEHKLYVSERAQGTGIGKAIMCELISIAEKKGCHTMIAEIDSANTRSVKFHEAFGFEELGTLRKIARKFDRWLDLVFMQKTIGEN